MLSNSSICLCHELDVAPNIKMLADICFLSHEYGKKKLLNLKRENDDK